MLKQLALATTASPATDAADKLYQLLISPEFGLDPKHSDTKIFRNGNLLDLWLTGDVEAVKKTWAQNLAYLQDEYQIKATITRIVATQRGTRLTLAVKPA